VSPSDGAILVEGSIGSGKSTALTTVGVLSALADPDSGLIGVDAGGGELASLLSPRLGRNAVVVSASDLARVTRLIDRLHFEMRTRRESKRPGESVPPSENLIVVLIDGLPSVVAALARNRGRVWYQRLVELVAVGREYFIWVVASSPLRGELPADLRDAFRNHITLADAQGMNSDAIGIGAEPGRGRLASGEEVQLFVPDGIDASACRNTAAHVLAEDSRTLAAPAAWLLTSEAASIPFGHDDVTGEPVSAEIGHRHLLIVGVHGTGRSHALGVIAESVSALCGQRVALLKARERALPVASSSATADLPISSIVDADALHPGGSLETSEKFVRHCLNFSREPVAAIGGRTVVLIDDAHLLGKSVELARFIEAAAALQLATFILATDVARASFSGWEELKSGSQQILFLRPRVSDEENDGSRVIFQELVARPFVTYEVGAGIYFDQGRQTMVQVAHH
jgi:hypothetical protein